MNPIDLTAKQLRKAASIKEHIEALKTELQTILGGTVTAGDSTVPLKRRRMSRAGRAAIAAAARARWAEFRRANTPTKSRRKRSGDERSGQG